MELYCSYPMAALLQVDLLLQSSKCFILEFMFQISIYQTDPPTEVIAVVSGKGRTGLEFWGLKGWNVTGLEFWALKGRNVTGLEFWGLKGRNVTGLEFWGLKGWNVTGLEFCGLNRREISQHFWGSCWFHLQIIQSVSEAGEESSSKMLVTMYQSIRRHFPEDRVFIMHPPSQKKGPWFSWYPKIHCHINKKLSAFSSPEIGRYNHCHIKFLIYLLLRSWPQMPVPVTAQSKA